MSEDNRGASSPVSANEFSANNRMARLPRMEPDSVTRRGFITSLACAGAASILPSSFTAQEPSRLAVQLASDPMRHQFHLLPAGNWMNDPNGPIYFNGLYHMFFQLNPHGSLWGDMNWAHAVSRDMIHWRHLPIALSPTPGGPDAAGCFTGSAVVVGKRVYLVYTGVVNSTPDMATLRDGKHDYLESQCLAWSDDPKLIHWTKQHESIIPAPPKGLAIVGFRDPSVWKQDSYYYMTVGTGMPETGGGVLLYRSDDLRNWTYLHLLASGHWNSKPSINRVASGEMWECPELFELDGRHVLIYSTEGKVFWETGRLDNETLVFSSEKRGQLDYGKYYAPKTQLDSSGKRILWGWIPETRPDQEIVSAGWAGMMSLPRILSVDTDGTLRMRFLPKLMTLRGTSTIPDASLSNETTATLIGGNGETLITGPAESGSFDLNVMTTSDEKPLLQLSYQPAKRVVLLDGKELNLSQAEDAHVHAYFDGSVVELVVNGQIFCTKRFYYDQARAPDISLNLSGKKIRDFKVTVWKINPISNNRLTTPSRNN
jgi:beta-fructofuranosidase